MRANKNRARRAAQCFPIGHSCSSHSNKTVGKRICPCTVRPKVLPCRKVYTTMYTLFGVSSLKQLKASETSPVRMRPADKKYVEKLARDTKVTQTEVLHHAVELLKRERQFAEMREVYAGLSQAELGDLQAESLMLDKATGDGIE